MERTQGQWNAYVEAGKTKEDRRSRLEEVPENMRDDVVRHVETVFAIRAFHKGKAKEMNKKKRMIDINNI